LTEDIQTTQPEQVFSRELVVTLDGLTRTFGDVKAADNVSFEIYSGDIFGFIGPNGAGKTTTMRMLATLDLPDDGDATIAGYSVVNEPDKIRPLIGYMPDNHGLYSNLTVYEYLDFFARSFGVNGKKRRESLEEIIEFTGMENLIHKPSDKLSKGMRQRLSLARSLIHDPEVLILDEPAEGLDPRARIEFRELLRVLASDGKAILISSHILTELSEICPRVAIIEQGKILASGPVADIKNKISTQGISLKIRVMKEKAEGLETFLLEQPLILQAKVVDNNALAIFSGSDQQQTQLLKAMIDAGFPVIEFGVPEQNLEDLFMSLTDGKVQ